MTISRTVTGSTMRFALVVIAPLVGLSATHMATAKHEASCTADLAHIVTVRGTIRFLQTKVRPMIGPDGKPDFDIVDMIDEYELLSTALPCNKGKIRVRIEFGDVRTVACADNVAATVTGYYERDETDGETFLRVIGPSALVCKAPPSR